MMEALAALDDDVHPPVVEDLEHAGDARAGADLVDAALGLEHDAELAVLSDALVDELPVARLEDVQRNSLSRKEDETEREESELRHANSLRIRCRNGSATASCGAIGTLLARSRDRHVTFFSVGSAVGGGMGCPGHSLHSAS